MRIAAMTCLIASLAPIHIAAQVNQDNKPNHLNYELIDLGTLGGANSQVNGTPPPMINNGGVVAGQADTSMPCSYLSGVVSPAFMWEDGALIDLGLLPGGCFSLPNSINSKGMIVGSGDIGVIDPATGQPEIRADLRYKGQIVDLGTFGGTNSLADEVNNRGQAVGGAENTDPDPWNFGGLAGLPSPTAWHGFLWEGGVLRDLGTLGGPDSFALVNNERGQIVGFSFTNSTPNPTTTIPTVDPFLWDEGQMIDLGTLGGTFGIAGAINERGQVVGFSDVAGDVANHAFIWQRGVLADIGTLGGANSSANWINDAGQVIGTGDLADGTHHAFVWSNGAMTDLGTLGGDPCSNGFHINASGQAIGTSTDCHGKVLHIFLWQNGSMTDLSAQVLPGSNFSFIEPVAINDRGEIVADGILANGDIHAVVLKPAEACDSDCDARMTAEARGSSSLNPGQIVSNSVTALREKIPSTVLERVQAQMRLHYSVPGSHQR
jgi:probable HAF family extracellular repeat protein